MIKLYGRTDWTVINSLAAFNLIMDAKNKPATSNVTQTQERYAYYRCTLDFATLNL